MPFLKVSDLDSVGPYEAVATAVNYVSRSQLARMRATVVPPGTVLMPKIGAAIQGCHRRVRLGVSAAFDNNVVALVPLHVDSRYLTYWLSQLPVEPLTLPGAVASLDMAAFRALSLPNLRLMTQREVSEFLDQECARIDELRSLVQLQRNGLDARRAAVVREAVSGLRIGRLKFGFRVTDCKHRTPEYCPTGFPVVSTREVKRGALDLSLVDRFVHRDDYDDMRDGGRDPRAGDIVYSRNASVGVAAYLGESVEVCMGQDVVLITRRPGDCELLAYVLNYAIADQVERLSLGSTFSRINVPVIRSLLVPYDSPEAEAAPLARIRSAFANLAGIEAEMASTDSSLAEYRDALITEAVTGQLDASKLSESHLAESLAAVREGESPEVLA